MLIFCCIVALAVFCLCGATSKASSSVLLDTLSESLPAKIVPTKTSSDALPRSKHQKRKHACLKNNSKAKHKLARRDTKGQSLSKSGHPCKHRAGARQNVTASRTYSFSESIQTELALLHSLKHGNGSDKLLNQVYSMYQNKRLKFWFSFVWLVLASKISLQFLLLLVKRCNLSLFTDWHLKLNKHSSLIDEYNRHPALIALLPFKAPSFDASWQFLGYAFLQENDKLFELILDLDQSSLLDSIPEDPLLMARTLAVESVRPFFAATLRKYWPEAESKVLATDITLQMLVLKVEASLPERLQNGIFCSKTLNTIVANDRLDLLQQLLLYVNAKSVLPKMFIWHCLIVYKRVKWFPIVEKRIHAAGIDNQDALGNTPSTLATGNTQLLDAINSISTKNKSPSAA